MNKCIDMDFSFLPVALVLLSYFVSLLHGEGVVHFVLIGATGDLAKKDLWPSLLDVYVSSVESGTLLKLYGGARAEPDVGSQALHEILKTRFTAPNENAYLLDEFVEHVQYAQLKTCTDYEKLCEKFVTDDVGQHCYHDGCKEMGQEEAGRLFYLSVPPFTYPEITDCINRYCRPSSNSSWFRIVLEKPFGESIASVRKLLDDLKKKFTEDEVYCMDHFLGKAALKAVLPFRGSDDAICGSLHRQFNAEIDRMLSAEHVERVEIVLKEVIDVTGRINFYNQYGAILDVIQNHLMEELLAVALDLPDDLSNSHSIIEAKRLLLQSIHVIHPSDVVVGQYNGYSLTAQKELKNDSLLSNTATYAGVVVFIANQRWHGTPFYLIHGKAMSSKGSYTRIIFKQNSPCIKEQIVCEKSDQEDSLTFFLNSEKDRLARIVVSKRLASFKDISVPPYWLQRSAPSDNQIVFEYDQVDKPYVTLIRSALNGRSDHFVSSTNMMASWEIWQPLLEVLTDLEPRVYPKGNIDDLAFYLSPEGLEFMKTDHVPDGVKKKNALEVFFQVPGEVIVLPRNQLYDAAVLDFFTAAQEAIRERGVFHVAFSGGSSPLPLYRLLGRKGSVLGFFSWHLVHVWLVDDRCVPPNDDDSNARVIQEHFIRFTGLPVTNMHLMPVELASGFCVPEDLGPALYERWFRRFNPSGRLDYVVLGVGADGHVASVFPRSISGDEGWSLLSTLGENKTHPGYPTPQRRMSISLGAINAARRVIVFVVGSAKHGVVEELHDGEKSVFEFPAKGIEPVGILRWFVDFEAYSG